MPARMDLSFRSPWLSAIAIATLCSLGCTPSGAGSDSTTDGGSSGGADDGSTGAASADSTTGVADSGGSSGGGEPDGEMLYTQLCATCHGADAAGTALGYELRHPEREYARWVVRNGRAGNELAPSVMTPFAEANLSDAQLDAIFDYLDATYPKPADGATLFAEYCRNCHGADALGGETMVNIKVEGAGEYFEKVREGNGGTDYGGRTSYMPAYDASELSDADIQAIVDYVATL